MIATAFPTQSGPLLLDGAAGAIDALVEFPASDARDRIAVICHPHPLHGGTMTNKVVTSAERALRDLGCVTLRFNFRGTGRSAGTHDEGRGEGDDLVALCAWLRAAHPGASLVLAGFSFGAYVTLLRAAEIAPQWLISLAPSVGRRDFSNFRPPRCPWLLIQPDADEVVDPAGVHEWAQAQDPPPTLVRFDGASHFFHGRLIELREAIESFARTQLPTLFA
jgi:uncharacterized protein